MGKQLRQSRIAKILREQNISTQEELACALRREGFEVTQATVSRDIREMGLRKIHTPDGGQRYAAAAEISADLDGRYGRVMKEGIVSMEPAQNIVVIKTVSGMAMGVAAAVDAMRFPEMVGCIAGDDTMMIAARTAEDAERLIGKLSERLLS